jgi:hypothetical protein
LRMRQMKAVIDSSQCDDAFIWRIRNVSVGNLGEGGATCRSACTAWVKRDASASQPGSDCAVGRPVRVRLSAVQKLRSR